METENKNKNEQNKSKNITGKEIAEEKGKGKRRTEKKAVFPFCIIHFA